MSSTGCEKRRRVPTAAFAAVLLCLTGVLGTGRADPAPGATPSAQPIALAQTPVLLDLAGCLRLGLEKHPRLAAVRASLAAAVDAQQALENLKIPAFIDPEIPVRRCQAALGLTAVTSRVARIEGEVTYAVTRMYFAVLYAREQQRVARGVVSELSTVHSTAKRAVDAGARDVTVNDVNRTMAYQRLAEVELIKAVQGEKRALAALREAIGVGPYLCFDLAPASFVAPDRRPCKNDILHWALTRRGEILEATVFAKVASLEVEGQGSIKRLRADTFAAGTDIHGRRIPAGRHDEKYVPGAIAPEMPIMLAGSRRDRIKTAYDLQCRAWAVVEETTHLIALDAENAFLEWEEASQQAAKAGEAVQVARKLADTLLTNLAAGSPGKLQDVITAAVMASRGKSQYNEYVFNEIRALADLERATAGAFCAGLVEAASQPVPSAPKTDESDKKKKKKDKDPFATSAEK